MTFHPSIEFANEVTNCYAQFIDQKQNADLEKNIAIVKRTNVLY
jgi:hypothetical protein